MGWGFSFDFGSLFKPIIDVYKGLEDSVGKSLDLSADVLQQSWDTIADGVSPHMGGMSIDMPNTKQAEIPKPSSIAERFKVSNRKFADVVYPDEENTKDKLLSTKPKLGAE